MGVLLAMMVTAALTRRRRPDQQVGTTAWGLAVLATSLVLLCLASALVLPVLIRPVLFVFGVGFGIFTVGGVSLLMAMSRPTQAASYLALWSMVQLVTRGFGISMGGVIRDVALELTGAFPSAYAALFAIEALGLYLCIYLLMRVNVPGFARQHGTMGSTTALLAAADSS
jgi:BCD family chlorophyll transporter-like MFS transporter